MNAAPRPPAPSPCPEFERRLVLYVWDELQRAERATVEQHAAQCERCAAALERERTLLEHVSSEVPETPSDLLIADCRRSLARELDRAEASAQWWKRLRAALRPAGWLVARPAWTVAALVLAGFFAGRFASRPPVLQPEPAAENQESAPASYENSAITGVQRLPNGGVAVRLTTEQPVVVQGTLDDGAVRQALLEALAGSRNPDADLRLESVDLLRARRTDDEVRRALCQAALHDSNPSVRLKAVEALRGMEKDAEVRRTLLGALEHDPNPGVRVEAVTALRSFLDAPPSPDWTPEDHVLQVLRDRQRRDPNAFVRLQSDAAIRQISSRDVQ